MIHITFEDLLELPLLKKCRLVAGKEGIKNLISWPYVVLSTTIIGWVNGCEVAIYAKDNEASFEQQIAVYQKLLSEAHECHVSAIIISLRDDMNDGLPESILSLSNEYKIPLLEAPWGISSNDFAKAIINYIIHHQTQDVLSEEFVRGMLLGTDEDRTRNIRFLPTSISGPSSYFIITAAYHNKQLGTTTPVDNRASNYEYIATQIRRYLSLSFEHLNSSIINGNAVYILSADHYDCKMLSALLTKIISALTLEYPNLDFHFGISRVYMDIAELCTAYRESCISACYSDFLTSENSCFSYADKCCGLILLSNLSNNILTNYYKQVLGPLASDTSHIYTELLSSLKCYIRFNCNLTQSAEALFVHKNTLRNRLTKIEEITGRDLSQAQDLYDITTALLALDLVTRTSAK